MSAESTRGKLDASFAHRLGYIDDVQLAAAWEAWRSDQTRSLLDLLVVGGALGARARSIVEETVDAHVAEHGGDVERCYAGILREGWVPPALRVDEAEPSTDLGGAIEMGTLPEGGPVVGANEWTETISLGSYASGGSRYRLVRRIGAGGQGEVYEAIDTELNREVLLKQLLARHAADPESRARFLRETRTGANLEHPGIVPVYDIGQHPGGQLFQVMRYFRPGSLRKKIASYYLAHPDSLDELSFRTLLGHFATACRAIDYAHSRDVHHLDIKPHNIVTGEFGETQIIDWGLALITDGDMLERVSEAIGTLDSGSSRGDSGRGEGGSKPNPEDKLPRGLRGTRAYAAPEQWKWDQTTNDKRTDVYGLGATLFEILAGKPPFRSSSPTIEEDIEIGNVHRVMKPWVPASLRAICRKAMAVKPEDRYASAGSLADDVDRFLADEPVAAYPDPWQVRLWRFVKRHRTAVTTLAALVATTAVALAIGNVLVTRQRDRAVAAEKQAKHNAKMTREVIAEFIEKVADDEWGAIPGTGALRLGAVQNVVEKFPDILAQQPDDPQLQFDAALIYRRCANLHRVLGKLDDATPLYDKSQALVETLVEQHPHVALYRMQRCLNLLDKAEVVIRKAGPEAALPSLREALGDAELIVGQSPGSSAELRTLALVQGSLADAVVDAGRIDEGVTLSAEAVRNFDSVIARDADDDEETRFHTRLLAALAAISAADALLEAERPDEAKGMAEKAESSSAELSKLHPGDPNVDYVRAMALAVKSRALSRDMATADKGKELEGEAVELLRRLVADSPQEANFRPALSEVLYARSETLLDAGKITEAVKIADEAIAAVAPLDLPTGAAEVKRCLARAHAVGGRASRAAGDAAAAQDHDRLAREYYQVAVAASPENKKLREEAAEIWRLLAE